MATHDDFDQVPAPQSKKSSGSKVLLILGTIAGLCLVLCCGGPAIVYVFFKDTIKNKIGEAFSISMDPAEVKQKTEELVIIDLPENYTPMSAMRFSPGMLTMKMIIYQTGANGQGGLVLMEMNQPGANPKQMREQMLQQMRQQQTQGGPGGFNSQITPQSTETKMLNINGEEVEFDFVKGTRGGDPTVYHQVLGTFQGRNGTILLMFIIPDSEYDEEAVVKIIRSIRIPGSANETEETTESSGEEGMTEKEKDEAGTEAETAPDKSE